MIFRPNPRRGFALIAVIGVMVMLIVFLAAMQGSVGVTVAQDGSWRGGLIARPRPPRSFRCMSRRMPPRAKRSAWPPAAGRNWSPRFSAGRAPQARGGGNRVPACGPATAPGARPLDGDGLLTITWVETAEAEQWLMNTRQRRGGAIRLGAIADQPASITTPLAE